MVVVARALIVFGLGVLPVLIHPLRLENHETHRAGVAVVIALLALLTAQGLRERPGQDARPVLVAIGLCAAALVVSSARFAKHVARHLEQVALGALQPYFPGVIEARAAAEGGELTWDSSDGDVDDEL